MPIVPHGEHLPIEGWAAANNELLPYLTFEKIEDAVKDSALLNYHKRKGHSYYVDYNNIFPNSEITRLRSYTFTNQSIGIGFYSDSIIGFDELFWGDSFVIPSDTVLLYKESSGDYYLETPSGTNIAYLGKPYFAQKDNFWQILSKSKDLLEAVAILLCSLFTIVISCFCYIPKSRIAYWPPFIIVGVLIVLSYGYYCIYGLDTAYNIQNVTIVYVLICWLCSSLALYIPLGEEKILSFLSESEKKDIVESIKGRWWGVTDGNKMLVFNDDSRALYSKNVDDSTSLVVYNYAPNDDGSILLTNGNKNELMMRHYYRNLGAYSLYFKDETYTKSGNSLNEENKRFILNQEINERIEHIADIVLGKKTRHSGGNAKTSLALIGFGIYSFCIWYYYSAKTNDIGSILVGSLLSLSFSVWGIVRLIHKFKFMSRKRQRVRKICRESHVVDNNNYDEAYAIRYARYCLEHGEITINDFNEMERNSDDSQSN